MHNTLSDNDRLIQSFLVFCDLSDIYFGMFENEDKYELFTLVVSCVMDNEVYLFSSQNRDTIKSKEAFKYFYAKHVKDIEVNRHRMQQFFPSILCAKKTEILRTDNDFDIRDRMMVFLRDMKDSHYFHESDDDSGHHFDLGKMRDTPLINAAYKTGSQICIHVFENSLSGVSRTRTSGLIDAAVDLIIRQWRDFGMNDTYPVIDINTIVEKAFDYVYNECTVVSTNFRIVTLISSLYYEHSLSRGRISVLKKGKKPRPPCIKIGSIEFVDKNMKLLRKLLKTTEPGFSLVISVIDGLSKITAIAKSSPEDEMCCFNLTGHLEWNICIASPKEEGGTASKEEYEIALRYKNDRYYIPQEVEYKNFYITNRLADFKETFRDRIAETTKAMMECVQSSHQGALIIIKNTTDTKRELRRLCKNHHGIEFVNPIVIDDNNKNAIMSAITSIDGAVLMDPDKKCYGMGLILDGLSNNVIGDKARGSKYNSAKTYTEYFNRQMTQKGSLKLSIALVVSVDGYVDILPRRVLSDDQSKDDEIRRNNPDFFDPPEGMPPAE